jgi:hypothetical protein
LGVWDGRGWGRAGDGASLDGIQRDE